MTSVAEAPQFPRRRRPAAILACEVVGFTAIIALSWLNELLGVPSLIFGSDHLGGWHESLLETIIILLVAVPVIVLTRRLVSRLHYLEEFARLCLWWRKLEVDGDWAPVEEFLQRKFETRASHGICPSCQAQHREILATRRRPS
jgi:hypothetical protein